MLEKIFGFAILLSLLPNSLFADDRLALVQGQIIDQRDRAVEGALVEIPQSGLFVVTDRTGHFLFEGLGAGTYRLEISAPGYRPAVLRETWVEAGSKVDLSLRLVESFSPQSIQVEVVGQGHDAVRQIPGATHVITTEQLQNSQPLDLNEVLRRVPGVYVREDSGPVSMRLNMGVRGLDPTRSRQLLVLEDGIPLALGPYGEPEMYYTPPIDRLERIEILKGSGSVLFGPQTVGGVVNFVTPDPPLTPQGSLELAGGQRGLFVGKLNYGGTLGNTGAFLSLLRKQGDGFRDFFFNINDITGKLVFALSDRQKLGVKLNYYDEFSNSTYLGLTQPLFEQNPNFNAVPDDRLVVRRYAGSVAHQLFIGPERVLTTTFYAYMTTRNWQRQDFDRTDRGAPYRDIFGDPTDPGGAIFLRNSTGNRNRHFEVVGVEPRLQTNHRLFGLSNRLETGFRFHFERAFEKRLDGERFNSPTGNLREDEIRTGHAFAAFAQNRFFLTEGLILSPGLRLERFTYERHILRQRVDGVPTDVDLRENSDVFQLIPGLGLSYDLGGHFTLFTGVHKGFAPPRIKDAISSEGTDIQLDAESSWNTEVGTRFTPSRWSHGELTFFALEFENQIIPASEAGGAVATLTNAGKTSHRGLEGALGVDLGGWLDWRFSLLTEVRYSHLARASFESGVFDGNRLPYAPENLLTLLIRFEHPRGINLQLDGSRVGDHFTDKQNTRLGSLDGTVGIIPSYTIWNLTAGYRLPNRTVMPFVAVKNLTDLRFIASRAPEGIQPGHFRQVNFGLRVGF